MVWETSFHHFCSKNENEGAMVPTANMTEVQLFIKQNDEYHAAIENFTPDMIYNTLLISLAKKFNDAIYAPPQKSDIKAMVKRIRKSNYPNWEKLNEWPLRNTVNGLPFYKGMTNVYFCKNKISCIFWASTEGLNLLKQCDHMFIDGTFKVVPKPFKQLLIIIGLHRYTKVFFPASFILMSSKSMEAYELVLRVLKSWYKKEESFPKRITTDFEIGLVKSIELVFPSQFEIVGCYFHFKQAIYRKLKKFGAAEHTTFLTNLSGTLTLVTINDIYIALDYFEEKEHDQKLGKVVQKFSDYFEEFWISKFEYWNISRFKESFGNLK